MRHLWTLAAMLMALPCIVMAPAARAQDSEAVFKRYEALVRKIETGKGPPRTSMSRDATAYDLLGKPGIGWHCQLAQEIMPQLNSVALNAKQLGTDFASAIGKVALGQGSESTRQVQHLANTFGQGISQLLTQPAVKELIKDLDGVSRGLGVGGAMQQADTAGVAADAAARNLRKITVDLQTAGVQLSQLTAAYPEARAEVERELAALKGVLKDGSRINKLVELEGRVRSSRSAKRPLSQWDGTLKALVQKGFKDSGWPKARRGTEDALALDRHGLARHLPECYCLVGRRNPQGGRRGRARSKKRNRQARRAG